MQERLPSPVADLPETGIKKTPLLTPTQRRLVALLIEHPEGASVKELLAQLVGIKDIARNGLAFLENNLFNCRARMGSNLRIYCVPARPQEETKYFLMDKQEIGEKIRVSVVEEDELVLLPEPTRQVVDNLCNHLTVKSETRLRGSVNPTQHRLLFYLANHFGSPCSTKELVTHVLQQRLFFSSDSHNINVVKSHLQKALQGSELSIFTVNRCFGQDGSGLILSKRDRFQGKEKGEVPIVGSEELVDIDERIQASVQKMCNRVRVSGLSLYPLLGSEKRKIVLALAKSFPKGRKGLGLREELFPNSVLPSHLLTTHIYQIKKIIPEKFPDVGLDIEHVTGAYFIKAPNL